MNAIFDIFAKGCVGANDKESAGNRAVLSDYFSFSILPRRPGAFCVFLGMARPWKELANAVYCQRLLFISLARRLPFFMPYLA